MKIFSHNRLSRMLRFLLTAIALHVSLRAMTVFAQVQEGPKLIPDSGTIGNCSFITGEIHFDCIPLYLSYLIKLLFSLAGGFAMVEIIKGGYEYAASGVPGGFAEKESAKKRITHALAGLAVVILAYLIVDTLVSVVFLGPPA